MNEEKLKLNCKYCNAQLTTRTQSNVLFNVCWDCLAKLKQRDIKAHCEPNYESYLRERQLDHENWKAYDCCHE